MDRTHAVSPTDATTVTLSVLHQAQFTPRTFVLCSYVPSRIIVAYTYTHVRNDVGVESTYDACDRDTDIVSIRRRRQQ